MVTEALRFGIHSGQQNTDFAGYVALWQAAEHLGFDWASVFDHFLPIESDPEGPCFEGMALLAAMASSTRRLRCGVIVLGVTYRHPAVVANQAATIDHISGGRLELGLGAAWYELEHRQYGIPFPAIGDRMDMLEEACHVVRSLWTEHRTTFEGRHYRLRDALCEPKPIQERLPLWIGGSGGRRTLPIVAEPADGWNTFFSTPEQYRHKLDVLESHCRDVGRDPTEIRKQLVFRAILGEDEREAEERLLERAARTGADPEQLREKMLVAGPERCVEQLRPYLDLGARDFLVLARPPADLRTLELVANDVALALRSL